MKGNVTDSVVRLVPTAADSSSSSDAFSMQFLRVFEVNMRDMSGNFDGVLGLGPI